MTQHQAYLSKARLEESWHELHEVDVEYRLENLRRGANIGPFWLGLTRHPQGLCSGILEIRGRVALVSVEDRYDDDDDRYLISFPSAAADSVDFDVRTFFGLRLSPYLQGLHAKSDRKIHRPYVGLAALPEEVGFGIVLAMQMMSEYGGHGPMPLGDHYLLSSVHGNSRRHRYLTGIQERCLNLEHQFDELFPLLPDAEDEAN